MPINLKFLDNYVVDGRGRIVPGGGAPLSSSNRQLSSGMQGGGSSNRDGQERDDDDSEYLGRGMALSEDYGSDDYSFTAALRGLQESFAPPPTSD